MSSPRTPRPFLFPPRREEGNLTSRKSRTTDAHVDFQYDYRNRLVRAFTYNDNGAQVKTIVYTYDAADRLTDRWASGSEQRYVYDGSDVIFTFGGATGSPQTLTISAQTLASRFLYGPTEHQVLAEDTPKANTAARTPTRWYERDYDDRNRLTGVSFYNSSNTLLRRRRPPHAPRRRRRRHGAIRLRRQQRRLGIRRRRLHVQRRPDRDDVFVLQTRKGSWIRSCSPSRPRSRTRRRRLW